MVKRLTKKKETKKPKHNLTYFVTYRLRSRGKHLEKVKETNIVSKSLLVKMIKKRINRGDTVTLKGVPKTGYYKDREETDVLNPKYKYNKNLPKYYPGPKKTVKYRITNFNTRKQEKEVIKKFPWEKKRKK